MKASNPAAGDAEGTALGAQLVSGHWYRVARLAPRLRRSLRVHTHRYRGQLWYVVEDTLNAKFHRFDRQAWRIMGLLDGGITLELLWQRLAERAEPDTPSQEDILALLGQLHGLDLLENDRLPDLAELGRRGRRQARQRRLSRYANPLALRIPLLDPDLFLGAAVRRLAPVLNRWGALGWLLWVLPALLLVPSHWSELTGNVSERLLALDNLVLIALLFPLVKALHELGHGIACKLRGAEVHDMGIMLLIFLPVPYVEASNAWAFPDKRDRMLVGAAGMLVEIALAAAAFYLWLWLEPGMARALAFDVAVLTSLTTLVFNGNPLLRYDGYFILSDALEIPNLAQRAGRYWAYLFERYPLRREAALSPALAPGEAGWFFFYAPLAFAYRCFVMFSIAVFVSAQYFAAGMLLAFWSLVMALGIPLWRGLARLGQLVGGADARPASRRAALVMVAALLLLLFVVPLPHHTQADGVLWLPDKAVLRAGQAGFVERIDASPGSALQPGDAVLQLEDRVLAAGLLVRRARRDAAQARLDAVKFTDPSAAEQLVPALARANAELAHLSGRTERLTVRSETQGTLWLQGVDDLPGRHVRQGQVLGYVVPPAAPSVRVVVAQADADFIRAHTGNILVKLPFDAGRVWDAHVLRAVPAASNDLPSAALGHQGGGGTPTDPRDETGRKALVSAFEYELGLPSDFPYRVVGSRVSVRFEHPDEPLVRPLWRGLRRMFLTYFQA